jgi:lipoate-protein ligase A
MKSKSVYKVPNGKLLKIYLEYDDEKNIIINIKITGDFFAYPEESIDIIEKELTKTPLDKEILENKINQLIIDNNFEFIGLDAQGLSTGIMMCLK